MAIMTPTTYKRKSCARMIADDFQAAFKVCDVIAWPCVAHRGPPDWLLTDPAGIPADIFTCPPRWPACLA